MTLKELKRLIKLSVPVDGEYKEWERLLKKFNKAISSAKSTVNFTR